MADMLIAGRYRLERRLGTGGTSEVWTATDTDLGRVVAIKLPAADADPERFEREARAAAGLSHANVCALYDYGRDGERRYIVLEYLPGGSLEDRLQTGRPLPDRDTRRIAAELAAGLAHAHARGVVHRDLKPANVLFDAEGRAKIADFGLARAGDATGLTAAGILLGTAAYISPEQAAGRPATAASDVYAFGVILFRMLTGRLPFESSDALALVAMHRDLPAPAVSDLRPDAPALLESVAAAALAKSPADRPRDGAALVAELAAPVAPQGVDSTAVTTILRPPPRRRRPLVLGLAVALVAAAGVVVAMAVTLGTGTTTKPRSRPVTTASAPSSTAPAAFPESTSSTVETTTAAQPPTTMPPTTSAEVTTAPTTTAIATALPPPSSTTQPTTTAAPATDTTTTAPVTTAPVTTAPATTVPPATAPTTVASTSTDTTTTAETTTAPAPTTVPG